MVLTNNLGFPRIGRNRELKRAIESYWNKKIREDELFDVARQVKECNWKLQKNAGINLIPSNDFSLYDHVLDHMFTVGAIPPRYQKLEIRNELDLYFAMARGLQKDDIDITAMEMTKWFDTNYHYIVPEFTKQQTFSFSSKKVVEEYKEALSLGIKTKPVLLGPITFLLLGKEKEEGFNKIDLIDRLLVVYIEIFKELSDLGVEWVQLDEPFLALDISSYILQIYREAYHKLDENRRGINIQIATYFASLNGNLKYVLELPVQSIHIDAVVDHSHVENIVKHIPDNLILSLGVVDGRNVWINNYSESLKLLQKVSQTIGLKQMFIGPSCSLLHCPYDLDLENDVDIVSKDILCWLSFAKQKLYELSELATLLQFKIYDEELRSKFNKNKDIINSMRTSSIIHDPSVKERVDSAVLEKKRASPYSIRKVKQRELFNLPLFPTTTVGSLPQTKEIRKWRRDYTIGNVTEDAYINFLKEEIKRAIKFQESIGLDVLVNGEFERSDMVEYFASHLKGISLTKNGWVQCYGTRCVKPPIIYGDVSRLKEITVEWTKYAQSLTDKPVKALITGPMTMANWSFLRNDQSKYDTALQIALALSDEVKDLERAGIRMIQIDEPAFREGFPLQKKHQSTYIEGAIRLFKIVTSDTEDETQIHTHMCYSAINEIVEVLSEMDADVIFLEAARSQLQLLESLKNYRYPNDIGLGVYDIHSPRVPTKDEILNLIKKYTNYIPIEQLWINPDCGLKTRQWDEVEASLKAMVEAAKEMRRITKV